MADRTVGGTLRGDKQSSRRPGRGVWFGLILASGVVRAVAAQGTPDDPGLPRLTDPIGLAASRVTAWNASDGRWIYLSGDASILHGVEGIRAREAIVRIVDVSTRFDKILQVEVYAQGQVRVNGDEGPPRAGHHGAFRTSEVQLKCYQPSGPTTPKVPPWQLQIIRRSGFRVPTPAAGIQKPTQDEGVAVKGSKTAVDRSPVGPAPSVRMQSPVAASDQPPASGVSAAGGTGARMDADRSAMPKLDPMVQPAQFVGKPAPNLPTTGRSSPVSDPQVQQTSAQPPGTAGQPPRVDLPPVEGAPEVQVPNLSPKPGSAPPAVSPNPDDVPPSIQPLPGTDGAIDVPVLPGGVARPGAEGAAGPATAPIPIVPIMPGTQRATWLFPRSGRKIELKRLAISPEGVETWIVRGGINIVTRSPRVGTIDIEADEAVIWRGPAPKKGEPFVAENGETWVDDARQPMEVYLEGNVVLRQDENKVAGRGDQRTIRAPSLYYDMLTDRMLAPNSEIDMFAPSLLAPVKIKSPRLEQFRRPVQLPNGTYTLADQPEIRLEPSIMTGSRFPNPGYKVSSASIDLTRYSKPLADANTGKEVADGENLNAVPEDVVWRVDARQNFYYVGAIPAFYWPHIVTDIDDLEPPLRMIGFNTNNYFGQQLKADFNGFRLLGYRRPKNVDLWNVDVDYLSARTKTFPAIGSEMGWYGTDLIRDLQDPYHKDLNPPPHVTKNYFGYFDIWGLQDAGDVPVSSTMGPLLPIDVLGTGPAIVTNGPPGAGKAGFQRGADPFFQEDRLRLNLRHNQRFLPEDEEHEFEELRLQVEVGYASDRNFIEEYYKRLFDTGLDQETLIYGVWQKDSQYANIWAEANLQNWYTDTQWLPRLDYYRLGDSLFSNWFNYYGHTGADYASIHTDVMVNNPNLFAFLPYDPVSNTTGTFSSGRFYTSHELDMPLNIGNVVRFVPYVQGQVVGWTDQLGGGPLGHLPTGAMGRYWGAAGLRGEVTAWKMYPTVESDLWNVHALNNKFSFFFDARAAQSNVKLNNIAVQDDLDDNTYEYVRRYLAITSFTGGILPFPYDPRHLILREMLSPITATTDVQASINTVQLGVHQRLQTKRGTIGRRRIVDYMTFDGTTTYFPDAARDNFGTPWGLAQYNWQWYIGDRTSIVSAGWFDFFKLVGSSPLASSSAGYNPNGLNIITSGISISRPPRSNVFLGYSIIDTGPIKTSALNVTYSYWLSPKWFGTFSESYDFGDAVNLGTMFAFTRIGADYLTTIGLSVDPQRGAYTFAFQVTPRLGSGIRGGAASGTFDTRFAPTQ